jgi:cytoskeletal protein RodZ
VIDAATLLGNDRPVVDVLSLGAAAATPLRVVSVYGFDGGTAVLRLDGQIEVQADDPGSFTYTVADASGATADASVFVELAQEPPTTPPPSSTTSPSATTPSTTTPSTTTPSTTTPSTTTPTTVSPTTVSPASPTTNLPTTTPAGQGAGTPSTPPGGILPQTGTDLGQRLRLAATIVLLGVVLVVMIRRRQPASSRE